MLRKLPEMFFSKELLMAKSAEPLIGCAWLPDIQVMVSRDKASSTEGLYIAAKAGHNQESHNHNDVGNFMVFYNGKPLLIDFNIGPDMVSSTYEVKDYENPTSVDPRLWVPRQIGQRNAGGHVIVAAGSFISKGKKKLLILDSDWAEPRVWDLERYVARKSAYKEIGVHSCQ